MTLRAIIWVLLLAVGACTDRGSDGPAVVVSDSAGITIVESSRPAWTQSAWRVVQEPTVSIGSVDGHDAELLDRVTGALRLSDGRIVVLNAGSQEVRFYDSEGRHLSSVGARGAGPGEYQGAHSLLRMAGDSIFIADVIAGRFTVLDPEGRFARSYPVAWGRASPTGRLADGRLVSLSYADPQQAVAVGYARVPLHLVLFTPDGSREDTVAVLPGGEEFRVQVADIISNYEVPFARRQHVFVSGEKIYAGAGETFEIEVRRADGSIERLIRANLIPRTIEAADIDTWRQIQLDRATDRSRPAVQTLVRDAPVSATMPAYGALRVDAANHLWVRVYEPPPEPARKWQVFDPEGHWLGEVALPERFEVTDIGVDYVLGVSRDLMDVEYVQLYHIEKVGS